VTDIFLYSGDANPNNVVLSDPTTLRGGTKVDYTLSLAAGAYAYSGKSAALSVARNLALAVGAYAYSGKSAAVNVARNLPLAVGAYSYSGKAITVDLERKMPLAAGAYAYAGNAATLTYVPGAGAVSYSLSLAPGAYGYSGGDASLNYSSGVIRGGGYYRPVRKHWYEEHKEKQQALQKEVDRILVAISKKSLPKKKAARIKLPAGYAQPDLRRLLDIQKELSDMREREDEEDLMLLL